MAQKTSAKTLAKQAVSMPEHMMQVINNKIDNPESIKAEFDKHINKFTMEDMFTVILYLVEKKQESVLTWLSPIFPLCAQYVGRIFIEAKGFVDREPSGKCVIFVSLLQALLIYSPMLQTNNDFLKLILTLTPPVTDPYFRFIPLNQYLRCSNIEHTSDITQRLSRLGKPEEYSSIVRKRAEFIRSFSNSGISFKEIKESCTLSSSGAQKDFLKVRRAFDMHMSFLELLLHCDGSCKFTFLFYMSADHQLVTDYIVLLIVYLDSKICHLYPRQHLKLSPFAINNEHTEAEDSPTQLVIKKTLENENLPKTLQEVRLFGANVPKYLNTLRELYENIKGNIHIADDIRNDFQAEVQSALLLLSPMSSLKYPEAKTALSQFIFQAGVQDIQACLSTNGNCGNVATVQSTTRNTFFHSLDSTEEHQNRKIAQVY